MGLEQRIQDDYTQAMRSGDRQRKDALRYLRAALKNATIAKGGALTEEDVVAELKHQAKMRRDSIEQYDRGGRQDLVAAEQAELEVVMEYLPALLTSEEIEAAARLVIARLGAERPPDMGAVMRTLMIEIGSRADGKAVNEIVRRLLAE